MRWEHTRRILRLRNQPTAKLKMACGFWREPLRKIFLSSPPLNHFWLPDSSFADGFPLPTVQSAPQRANQLWKEALEAYCSGHKSRAYYLLGHVAHLLSDMTVPAHVHRDQHTPPFLDYDTFERWCADPNYLDAIPHAYRPNHERISTPLQGIDYFNQGVHYFKLPPYPIPPEFDTYLAAMFYNTARFTRQFDSDDSGHGFGPPSLVMAGRYNSFTLRLPVRTEMLPPASQTKLYRFNLTSAPAYTNDLSKGKELYLGWGYDLSRAYEYDSYSRNYPLDSCVYLYSGRGSFNGCSGSALYDLVDFATGSQHDAVCFADSGLVTDNYRFRKVPTSVLEREHLPQLLSRAIHAEAMLYHLFWNTTHHRIWSYVPDTYGYPRLIGDAAASGVVVFATVHAEGSNADSADFVSPCFGGAGGYVDIRTGVEVEVGDGRLGVATGTNILNSGVYDYSDVLSGAVLQCEGDVTIRCQHTFQPSRIELKPGALAALTSVTVFAGTLETVGAIPLPLPGVTGQHVYPNFAAINVYLAGQGTDAAGNGRSGGLFTFWTKARGGISASVNVNGGAGDSGGSGGAGGTCTIVANMATVIGSCTARGGGGSTLWQEGGAGGGGGQVTIAAGNASQQAVYPGGYAPWLQLDVTGGNGGFGRGWQGDQAPDGQGGADGFRGGNGGAGGTAVLALDDWSDEDAWRLAVGGGFGGAGGLGQRGGSGPDGSPQGGRGLVGGNGGRGGDGGAPSRVFLNLLGSTQSALPGGGGQGGQGGQGGNGGWNYPGGGYSLGGNGGNGGTAGSAGGQGAVNGTNGLPGLGGLGGYSGNVITGQPGQPGASGGTLSPTVSEPLAAPTMSCGPASLKPRYASIIAAVGQGFLDVRMGSVPLHTTYRLEASEDMRNWSPIGRTTTLDSAVSFRVAVVATPAKAKQFFRIVAE